MSVNTQHIIQNVLMPDINIAREPAINQAAQNKCDRLGTVIIGGAGGG
jgi:hypothetical protein